MPIHTDISAVLFRFPDEDPCCRDAAVLVALSVL